MTFPPLPGFAHSSPLWHSTLVKWAHSWQMRYFSAFEVNIAGPAAASKFHVVFLSGHRHKARPHRGAEVTSARLKYRYFAAVSKFGCNAAKYLRSSMVGRIQFFQFSQRREV